MNLDTLPEQAPKLYSISVEEFKATPEELQIYDIKDKITRDKFTNFLIKSFEVSRGSPASLLFFFVWLKLKMGFDYSSTLTNFEHAGGWEVLGTKEKEEFIYRFSKIPSHLILVEADIEEALRLAAKRAGKVVKIEKILPLSELKSLNNLVEFHQFISNNKKRINSIFSLM